MSTQQIDSRFTLNTEDLNELIESLPFVSVLTNREVMKNAVQTVLSNPGCWFENLMWDFRAGTYNVYEGYELKLDSKHETLLGLFTRLGFSIMKDPFKPKLDSIKNEEYLRLLYTPSVEEHSKEVYEEMAGSFTRLIVEFPLASTQLTGNLYMRVVDGNLFVYAWHRDALYAFSAEDAPLVLCPLVALGREVEFYNDKA